MSECVRVCLWNQKKGHTIHIVQPMYRCREKERERERGTEGERDRDRERDTDTQTQTHRLTDTDRHRHTDTQTQRHGAVINHGAKVLSSGSKSESDSAKALTARCSSSLASPASCCSPSLPASISA